MNLLLEIPRWTSHHNMLLYAYLHYCEQHGVGFRLVYNSAVPSNCAVMHAFGKKVFLDYSDDRVFGSDPQKYDVYFKRSLLASDYKGHIHPLNFQTNFTYKTPKLLGKMSLGQLTDKKSRVEVFRALDYFNTFTNLSHNAADVRKILPEKQDHGGRIIFHARLWNPDNNEHADEKQRRHLQNEFRIGACRVIKKHFKNATAGLFPDAFAQKAAPDLLLDLKKTSKLHYLNALNNSDIAIADDGLKDTPGWKIGEYVMLGKAVISTPLQVVIENFNDGDHFMELATRNHFDQIPDKIDALLHNKKYLEMGHNNFEWSRKYLHPKNYLERILTITANQTIAQ
jgi:hypothetical protein